MTTLNAKPRRHNCETMNTTMLMNDNVYKSGMDDKMIIEDRKHIIHAAKL